MSSGFLCAIPSRYGDGKACISPKFGLRKYTAIQNSIAVRFATWRSIVESRLGACQGVKKLDTLRNALYPWFQEARVAQSKRRKPRVLCRGEFSRLSDSTGESFPSSSELKC